MDSSLESMDRQAHTPNACSTAPCAPADGSTDTTYSLYQMAPTAARGHQSLSLPQRSLQTTPGGSMGIDGKRGSPVASVETDSGSELGHAVESEIIPTLVQILARESGYPADNASAGSEGTGSGVRANSPLSAALPTWLESQLPNSDRLRQNRRQSKSVSTSVSTATPAGRESWISPTEFAELVLNDSEELASQHFRQLRAQGIADEVLLLELLAPTSVELGRRWEQDLSDFADVTVGVCRLHRMLRSVHPQHHRDLDHDAHGGRVALAPAPGEQHSFGLLLVGELLFRAGWYTDVEIDSDADKLIHTVMQNWYEMVGISVSSATRLDEAAALISSVKKNSCNKDVAIIAGGHAFSEDRTLAFEIGADQVVLKGEDVTAITSRYIPKSQRI